MIRGLYTSATGMLVQQNRLDVISNNLANADNNGYKRDGVVSTSFSDALTKKLNDETQIEGKKLAPSIGNMSLGAYVQNVYTDFSQANLKQTDAPFDLALESDGYFIINVTNKNGDIAEKYTRDGSFTLGVDGSLMTSEGNYVQGTNGNIILPTGDTIINEAGEIYVNGEYIDKLKLVAFEDNNELRKDADNLLVTTENAVKKDYVGKTVQGFVEGSNVDSIQEMVNMITVMRNYEANQKLVQIHDQTLGKAVNDIK